MRQKTPRNYANFQEDFVYEGPSSLRKSSGDWTRLEDEKLESILQENSGEPNWKQIASNFVGRKDIDCIARWKEINPDNPNSIKCFEWLMQGRRSPGQKTKTSSSLSSSRSTGRRSGRS